MSNRASISILPNKSSTERSSASSSRNTTDSRETKASNESRLFRQQGAQVPSLTFITLKSYLEQNLSKLTNNVIEQLCIKLGNEINRIDNGFTLLDLAFISKRNDLVDILLKHGAVPNNTIKADYTPQQISQFIINFAKIIPIHLLFSLEILFNIIENTYEENLFPSPQAREQRYGYTHEIFGNGDGVEYEIDSSCKEVGKRSHLNPLDVEDFFDGFYTNHSSSPIFGSLVDSFSSLFHTFYNRRDAVFSTRIGSIWESFSIEFNAVLKMRRNDPPSQVVLDYEIELLLTTNIIIKDKETAIKYINEIIIILTNSINKYFTAEQKLSFYQRIIHPFHNAPWHIIKQVLGVEEDVYTSVWKLSKQFFKQHLNKVYLETFERIEGIPEEVLFYITRHLLNLIHLSAQYEEKMQSWYQLTLKTMPPIEVFHISQKPNIGFTVDGAKRIVDEFNV